MSRIGRAPIIVPNGVNITVDAENNITVAGPKGTLKQWVDNCIKIEKSTLEGKDILVLTRNSEVREVKSKHGLYRALIQNMVKGVTEGYSKTLVIQGVGYKAGVAGNKLTMNIGFSHPVVFTAPEGITISCPSVTEVKIDGFNKTLVGQVAADIKAIKPVEPYHNYGIHYSDEIVVKKEIKKATKKK